MSNSDNLKDALLIENNIARQGLKFGQEIGARDVAAKAKPLLDALEAIAESVPSRHQNDYMQGIARAAIEAYRSET